MGDFMDPFQTFLDSGFSVCVAIYLLYERSKFNAKITESLTEISTTMKIITDNIIKKG